jgi:hypothetical protein
MALYTMYQTGPDDRSTYPECWGSTRTSQSRKIASGSSIADLMDTVDAITHDNWWIRGPGGVCVAGSRKEFYTIPRIKNLLKWSKDGRAEKPAAV